MTEHETLLAAITHAHELGRIIVANQGLDEISKTRSEHCVRSLLALLYSRLSLVEEPRAKLPDNIKSDY